VILDHEIIPAASRVADGYHCLVLHGLGDSMAGWKPVVPMLGLPQVGFIVANAPIEYFGGWSWFDIHPDMSIDDDHVRASRARLAELIAHLLETLRIPSGRLFLCGFSQGCVMVVDAALRARAAYAGVVGISGFVALPDEYPAAFGSAIAAQRLLVTHGRFDGMIPIAYPRSQFARLRSLGATIDWREYDKEHTLDPVRELADIRAFLTSRMGAATSRA
jgi:phospholipase/carboxylesterase